MAPSAIEGRRRLTQSEHFAASFRPTFLLGFASAINVSARENDFFAEVFDENDHFLTAVDGQTLERDARKEIGGRRDVAGPPEHGRS